MGTAQHGTNLGLLPSVYWSECPFRTEPSLMLVSLAVITKSATLLAFRLSRRHSVNQLYGITILLKLKHYLFLNGPSHADPLHRCANLHRHIFFTIELGLTMTQSWYLYTLTRWWYGHHARFESESSPVRSRAEPFSDWILIIKGWSAPEFLIHEMLPKSESLPTADKLTRCAKYLRF